MAEIIPADWQDVDFLHEGEKDTLAWLEEALGDDFVIYAGVHWASAHKGYSTFGEVDFAITGPSGKLVVIEQKNGGLRVEDGALVKEYGGHVKRVGDQVHRSLEAVFRQWKSQHPREKLFLDYLVYLPDYRVHDLNAVTLAAQRVVDREHRLELPDRIRQALGGEPRPEQARRVRDFLAGELDITLDMDIASLRMEQRYERVTDNVWETLRRLHFDPWHLHVRGRAGSGKTRLAARLYRKALEEGGAPLYLCFNRPLADALSRSLAEGGRVSTIDNMTSLSAGDTSLRSGEDFEDCRARLLERGIPEDWQADLVVVDEAQDFSASQQALARALVREGGRFLWLEDPLQALYDRGNVPPPETSLRMDLLDNYRCARKITRTLNALLQLDPPDVPASALEGTIPEFIVLEEGEALAQRVEQEVRRLLEQGFMLEDIALVTYRGLERSQLHGLDRIGPWALKRFTGDYDSQGRQRYTEGPLRLETVHRFKGMQARAVIFCDIDFAELDQDARARLYTGMTRARQHLTLVLHPGAGQVLQRQLAG